MFYWVYDIPTWAFGAILVFVFLAVTTIGTILSRPFVRRWIHADDRANDFVGLAMSCYSTFYGLLLGLVAVAAFQNYANVDDRVTKESGVLGSLYNMASLYPEPTRSTLQRELRDYVAYELNVGWPRQERGIITWKGPNLVTALYDTAATFEPQDRGQETLQAETLSVLNGYEELRRARLGAAQVGIPEVLWWVVAIGAMMNILLIWLFDMELHLQIILGAVFSCFIALVILLIAEMDYPFRGELSISPGPLRAVYTNSMLGQNPT